MTIMVARIAMSSALDVMEYCLHPKKEQGVGKFLRPFIYNRRRSAVRSVGLIGTEDSPENPYQYRL